MLLLTATSRFEFNQLRYCKHYLLCWISILSQLGSQFRPLLQIRTSTCFLNAQNSRVMLVLSATFLFEFNQRLYWRILLFTNFDSLESRTEQENKLRLNLNWGWTTVKDDIKRPCLWYLWYLLQSPAIMLTYISIFQFYRVISLDNSKITGGKWSINVEFTNAFPPSIKASNGFF